MGYQTQKQTGEEIEMFRNNVVINEKEPDYLKTHKEFCREYIKDLKKTLKEYHGKIADVYIYSLCNAINEIQSENENLLLIIDSDDK